MTEDDGGRVCPLEMLGVLCLAGVAGGMGRAGCFMFSKKGARKRRSDRLMFMIPLRVQGAGENGDAFECEGSAIAVNRYGAQIRLKESVALNRDVRLTNLATGATGKFRVVRVFEPSSEGGMDFGVEALEANPNFWGIQFPPRPKKPSESRALLECCRCHTVSLLPASLTDVEILGSGGVLMKPCAACSTRTPWIYAKKAGAGEISSEASQWADEHREPLSGPLPSENQAVEGSVCLQRPVSLETASGEVETVQTESASKDGISCTSERTYDLNQEVTLRWAHPASVQKFEARGRIVRRLDIGGGRRKIYNIRYESPIAILTDVSSKATRKLYWGFMLLVVAVALVIEINVLSLTSSFFISVNTRKQLAGFGVALLLICLEYKTWKAILAREPEQHQTLKRRHRLAAGFAVVLFSGALVMGVLQGMAQGREHAAAQRFLRDLAAAEIFERNIDAAENRVFNGPGDYVDACSTLELLAPRWSSQTDHLTTDMAALRRSLLQQGKEPAPGIERLQVILQINRQKARLVEQQIELKTQAEEVPSEKQIAYWQANFQPLRQKIIELDAQKNSLLKLLAAKK